MLDNDVETAEESSKDDDVDRDDDQDPEIANTLELADARAAEYSRLNNILSRNKNFVKSRNS